MEKEGLEREGHFAGEFHRSQVLGRMLDRPLQVLDAVVLLHEEGLGELLCRIAWIGCVALCCVALCCVGPKCESWASSSLFVLLQLLSLLP